MVVFEFVLERLAVSARDIDVSGRSGRTGGLETRAPYKHVEVVKFAVEDNSLRLDTVQTLALGVDQFDVWQIERFEIVIVELPGRVISDREHPSFVKNSNLRKVACTRLGTKLGGSRLSACLGQSLLHAYERGPDEDCRYRKACRHVIASYRL